MKKPGALIVSTLLVLILLRSSNTGNAATYYFSSSTGNDGRSIQEARSPATPWSSLAKLNSMMHILNPGDSVLFKRGDIFEGQITLTQVAGDANPIVFSAYGSGDKPTITGFANITGWYQVDAHTRETLSYTGSNMINMLLFNGIPQQVGRYPNGTAGNGGYLTISHAYDTTAINDNSLAAFPDWTGGEIVIRKNRWVIDRNTIRQHSGNTIYYQSGSAYPASDKFGYFIQNHPATLDQPGEWYYKQAQHKLGVYFSSASDVPDIKASTIDTLVLITGCNYIEMKGLRFTGANMTGMQISDAQNIYIRECEFLFSGVNAIGAGNTNSLTIENSLIDHTNNIACTISKSRNAVIRNNIIKNTGMVPGMGKNDSGSYEALMIDGDSCLVELNTFDSTGYIPVTFSGNSMVIRNNFINHFAMVKDDGGAIYTWNNGADAPVHAGREITGNIILNGKGAGNGTDDPGKGWAHGIYIDDNADHVNVSANTVVLCAAYGIFLHNAHDISVERNTSFNNSKQLVIEYDNIALNSPVRNIIVSQNILFSKYAGQTVAAYKTIDADLSAFGYFNDNFYCHPIDDHLVIETSSRSNSTSFSSLLDLDGWKTLYNKDANSQRSPVQIPPYTTNGAAGKNLYGNGSFAADIKGLYTYSVAGNCKADWAAAAPLDGGALRISFAPLTGGSNATASVIIGVGAVTANKTYLLKFSMTGGHKNAGMDVFLRKSLAPYNDISARTKSIFKSARTENTFLFTPSADEKDASIVFDLPEQDKPLYLDNIQLRQADVTVTDPGSFIRFEYNNTPFARNVSLPGAFVDARNIIYANNLTLAPYSSSILIILSYSSRGHLINKTFIKQ